MNWEDEPKHSYDLTNLEKEFKNRLYKNPSESIEPVTDIFLDVTKKNPSDLFNDAIKRILGCVSENELCDIIYNYTKVKLSLIECNNISQEIAQLVISKLKRII